MDGTLRVIFSLTHAVLLIFLLLGIQRFFGISPYFIFLILPVASFQIGFLLNILTQYITCSKLNFPVIALNSIFAPLLVTVALFLLYLIPSLENPVRAVLPFTLDEPLRKGLAQSFYLFWAGLYGQALAAGFLQGAC